MLSHGLVATVIDSGYLIYLLGAVVLAGIGAIKWSGNRLRELVAWLEPLVSDFFNDQKLTMHTARESLQEMAKSTANIQMRIDTVHQTLGVHGEKLERIDKRTAHLDS